MPPQTVLIFEDAIRNDETLNALMASLTLSPEQSKGHEYPTNPTKWREYSPQKPNNKPSSPDSSFEGLVDPALDAIIRRQPETPQPRRTTEHLPRPPSNNSNGPPQTPSRIYDVTSSTFNGPVESWPTAAHAVQKTPDRQGKAIRLTPKPRSRRHRRAAYVVYQGLQTGIFEDWDMCKMQVDGISNNIYEGFDSRADAERAYVLAYALGAVRVLANAGGDVQRNADPNPTPEAFMRVLRDAPDDFLGQEWHVVFKGKRPGVYPSWAFAANQTISVGRSVYQKYAIRADAMSAYQRARENGEIERL